MKINSSANVADSNILDKIRINMIAKSDYKNEKSNMDISITSDNNEISKISVIRDSDYYGIFNSDISSSYISVKNEKIGQFLSDIDFSNAGVFASDLIKGTKFDLTSNLASSIVDFEVKDVLEESKLQKKYFQKYFKMLKDVSDIAYTKKADDKIVIDGVNHNVTTYTLSLNEIESANLVKSIVDKMTQDSLTMDFITTKLDVYKRQGEEDFVEESKLGVLMSGNYTLGLKQLNVDFYVVKGIAEEILDFLGFAGRYSFIDNDNIASELHPGKSAVISVNNDVVGFVGRIPVSYTHLFF